MRIDPKYGHSKLCSLKLRIDMISGINDDNLKIIIRIVITIITSLIVLVIILYSILLILTPLMVCKVILHIRTL